MYSIYMPMYVVYTSQNEPLRIDGPIPMDQRCTRGMMCISRSQCSPCTYMRKSAAFGVTLTPFRQVRQRPFPPDFHDCFTKHCWKLLSVEQEVNNCGWPSSSWAWRVRIFMTQGCQCVRLSRSRDIFKETTQNKNRNGFCLSIDRNNIYTYDTYFWRPCISPRM